MAHEIEVRVPDIGDFDEVEVVEVLVAKGDRVDVDDALVSIESDKATMELPAPHAGVVISVAVSVGDQVSEGSLIARLSLEEAVEAAPAEEGASASQSSPIAAPVVSPPVVAEEALSEKSPGERRPHASPGVRRMARELGVDLSAAKGSGPAERILAEDVRAHVRERMAAAPSKAPSAAKPAIDFSRFGPVERVPLARIRRVSASHLARAWQQIPHVTQHEDADVTELEAFRKSNEARAREAGARLSPLVFVLKAVAGVLAEFPDFRSSLAPEGDALLVKDYFHIGVAVDTENGLIVPVLRDVDRKGIFELAIELAELAERARDRSLSPEDLAGGVFSISSLGGIGGTAFTPIVNAPEVAVLGLSRMSRRPVWDADAGTFVPRTLLPLSLSYDHRVIDGAAAARFAAALARSLAEPARLLL